MSNDNAPFYKQPVFWILMSGPFIVVIAAFFTFGFAHSNASDLVTDDYYKDGKHINLSLERDEEAAKRNIVAQVLISPDNHTVKVLMSGDLAENEPLKLLLMHPAKKDLDQVLELKPSENGLSGGKREYSGQFTPLPNTIHWYLRVEDMNGKWRVENKWLPNQGFAVELRPNTIRQ